MNERTAIKRKVDVKFSSAQKDLIIIAVIVFVVFVLSYFLNIFVFLVKLYLGHPAWLTYIDEILSVLVALTVGFAIFAWRRWQEAKKGSRERIRLQEENIILANTKADTERIIAKELRAELEYHKKIEGELLRLVEQKTSSRIKEH